MDADEIVHGLFGDDARDDPYPFFAALRELGPVSRLTRRAENAAPFAAVAVGYDVVDEVLRAPGFYKKAGPDWQAHPVLTTFQTSMMFTNPPDHGRLRAPFARAFTPRRLAALEPIALRVVDELLDEMADRGAGGGAFDYVAGFALPLPMRVMGAFLGIPEADLLWYRERVERIDAYLDIDGKSAGRLAAADAAATELRDFYAGLIADRRDHPRDDLISALVEAVDADAEPISEVELISNLVVLFNASFVTTIYMLGSGLPLLLGRPDVVAALPGNPDLALDCAHEILRCETPVQFATRRTYADTTVGDLPLAADEVVLMLLGAANRDPARWSDPDTFDPLRPAVPSLAFGAGVHYCLGTAVARVEGRVALPRLFARFPRIALAGPPVRTGSVYLRGLDALPVTLS